MLSEGSDNGEGVVAPAVLGEQRVPVYVPSQPMAAEDHEAQLELRRTSEGALALVTYTSLERLVEGCGNQQAWISVPESELRQLAEQVDAQVILQDVPLPDEQHQDEAE
ncbi:SAV_915 family protein [Salinifilum ghardaiensis]